MNKDIRTQIGQRLAELRRAAGFSQAQVAELTGLKQQNIARVEAGLYNTTVETVAKIAEVLRCELLIEPTSNRATN